MNQIWKTTAALLTTILVVLMPLANASAQPAAGDQTYVSEITGDEIDLGTSGEITFIPENFNFSETASFQEEYIWFTYGWSNFQVVLIAGPNEAESYHDITLGNMEDFYDSWELIDEELTDEHSWFLGEAEINGSLLIVYYEFELDAFGDIDLVVMQFTDISTFSHDLEFVQAEVTIGGDPLLPNTDALELSLLAGFDPGTPDPSPESEEENTSERGGRTTRGGTDSDDEGDDEETEPVTTGTSRTTRGGTDTSDEGDDEESEAETSGASRTTRGGTDTSDEGDDEESESETSGTSRTTRGGTDTSDEDDDEGNESETSGSSRTTRGGTDDSEGSDRESRGGRLGDTDSGTGTDADDDSTPVSGGDWDALGLISDTEWESPSYGNVVTWDSALWEFPFDYEYAVIVNEDPVYDIITLQTVDGLGYVYITVDSAYESTPRSLVEYWVTDDYQQQITNDVTVLDTATTSNTASMVYETTNSIDQPLVVVLEATFLDDGTVIFSQISAAPDTIDVVYEQYLDGVEVDGAPLELTWTVEDIRDISGN